MHIYRKKPLTTQDLRGRLRMLIGFGLITVVFINTTIANMIARPNGVLIASIFILCVMIISIMSRVLRSVAIPDRWVRLHRSCERPTADTPRTKALAAIDSKLAEPIVKGQRVFTCGHSFYVWVPGIVVDHIRELCSSDNNALGREATEEAVNKTRECLIRSSVTRVITGLLNLSRLKKQVGFSMGIQSSARVIDYPVDLSLEEQI